MSDATKKNYDKEKKDIILVVDDAELNRIILDAVLCEDYIVEQAADGLEALTMLMNSTNLPSLVLLDVMMPEMDGFEVLETMQNTESLKNIPVIFITAEGSDEKQFIGLSKGACDYIPKPFNADIVKARVDNHIELFRYRSQLESMVTAKVNELTKIKDRMLETLASIIEVRSLESGEHVRRTSLLTQLLIKLMTDDPVCYEYIKDLDYNMITRAGILHDIGKVAIPDRILLKPGKLTPEEFDVIKTHTTIGSDIIDKLLYEDDETYLRHCHDICRHHHEMWNGRGYPDGLAGFEIPVSARIVAIVDVYDALVNERVYKPAFTHEQAMEEIVKKSSIQFDPEIIRVLEKNHLMFKRVYEG